MTQISNLLCQMFSAVEHLILEYNVHGQSSGEHNMADHIKWCKFLRPFRNTKILCIEDGLDEEITCCLQLNDGKLPLDLLPELHNDEPGSWTMGKLTQINLQVSNKF